MKTLIVEDDPVAGKIMQLMLVPFGATKSAFPQRVWRGENTQLLAV